MSNEIGACYAAFRAALADGTASWGTSAFAEQVPVSVSGAKVSRPYVVYSFGGGGDMNNVIPADPNLLIDVIAEADQLSTAIDMDSEIRARLDNYGAMDATRTIAGDAMWMIKTITRETRVHFVENVQGATQIYHSGARYRVLLEKR